MTVLVCFISLSFFSRKLGENTGALLVNLLGGNVRMTVKHLAHIINIL